MLTGDLLDADHRLVARLVRQPRRAAQIADGIDARLAGLAIGTDHDMGAVHFDLGVLDAEIFHIADDAHGGDDSVDGQCVGLAALLDGHRDVAVAFLQATSQLP